MSNYKTYKKDKKTGQNKTYNSISEIQCTTQTWWVGFTEIMDIRIFFNEVNIRDCGSGSIKGMCYGKYVKGKLKKVPKGAIPVEDNYKVELDTYTVKTKKGYFGNQSMCCLSLDDKDVSVKIFTSGIHITGCRSQDHAISACQYIFMELDRIQKKEKVYTIKPEIKKMNSEMINMDFNLGFQVNMEELNNFIKNNGLKLNYKYYSDYTNVDNVSVNIKIPMIGKFNKKGEQKFHTFIVFGTGSVLFIGSDLDNMEPIYNDFVMIMNENKNLFENNCLEKRVNSKISLEMKKDFIELIDRKELNRKMSEIKKVRGNKNKN